MHKHSTKELDKKQVLQDTDTNGKIRPWRENKEKSILLAESYERLGLDKKYYRVIECGTYLEFKRYVETNVLKLYRANFCRDRLCPMCGWRRAKKVFGQTSRVMDKALENKDYRFIFLTLTCKNVEGDNLKDDLDNLFKAFYKMFKKTRIKKSIKGWFRALEITHNLDKNSENYNTYHPHFHIILMVNMRYFKDSELYLSQEDWTNLWKECLQVDYTPIVDVRAFKTGNKQEVARSVSESVKYTVKDNDYILPKDEKMTDNAVAILTNALVNRRLVAFGGELKKIHKELNLDDLEKDNNLINTNDEEKIRDDLNYVIERYSWNVGYRQYYKM